MKLHNRAQRRAAFLHRTLHTNLKFPYTVSYIIGTSFVVFVLVSKTTNVTKSKSTRWTDILVQQAEEMRNKCNISARNP